MFKMSLLLITPYIDTTIQDTVLNNSQTVRSLSSGMKIQKLTVPNFSMSVMQLMSVKYILI